MTDKPSIDGGDNSHRVAAAELRSLVERVERLTVEKKALTDDIKSIFAEAKLRGYDTKTMRKVLAIRKIDAVVYQEQQALLDTYCGALGIFG